MSGFSKKIFKAKQTTIFHLAYFDMEMKILQKPPMKIILSQVFQSFSNKCHRKIMLISPKITSLRRKVKLLTSSKSANHGSMIKNVCDIA